MGKWVGRMEICGPKTWDWSTTGSVPSCRGVRERLRPREPLCAAGIGAEEWTNFHLTTKTEVCHKVFHPEYQIGHP